MHFWRTLRAFMVLIAALATGCGPTYQAGTNTAFSSVAKDSIVVLGITSTQPSPGSRSHPAFWVGWTVKPTGPIRFYTDDVIEAEFVSDIVKRDAATSEITQYRVLRIPAGTYYLRFLESGNRVQVQRRMMFAADSGRLLHFTAAPGEIIYIGDLVCDASSGVPQLVNVRRNDDDAKATLSDFAQVTGTLNYRALRRYSFSGS